MQGIQEISVIPKLIGVTHTMSDYLDVSRASSLPRNIFKQLGWCCGWKTHTYVYTTDSEGQWRSLCCVAGPLCATGRKDYWWCDSDISVTHCLVYHDVVSRHAKDQLLSFVVTMDYHSKITSQVWPLKKTFCGNEYELFLHISTINEIWNMDSIISLISRLFVLFLSWID